MVISLDSETEGDDDLPELVEADDQPFGFQEIELVRPLVVGTKASFESAGSALVKGVMNRGNGVAGQPSKVPQAYNTDNKLDEER